jgi:hypothetical protein
LDFAKKSIKEIPFSQWPSKGAVVLEMMELFPRSDRISISEVLSDPTCDLKSTLLGICFKRAFLGQTLREIYPYLYRIRDLLPSMNYSDFRFIFGCNFYNFEVREDHSIYTDPPFTRRVNLKGKVFVHGNLMIGIVTMDTMSRAINIVAYDTTTNRLQWGIPIPQKITYWELTSLGLAIIYKDDNRIYIYSPETGEEINRIMLPTSLKNDYDSLHITPSAFCYLMTYEEGDRKLYGGSLSSGTWEAAFVKTTPGGRFEARDEFIYFRAAFSGLDQVLCDQSGAQVNIPYCNDIFVKNNTFFMFEKASQDARCGKVVMQSLDAEAPGVFQLHGPRSEVLIEHPDFRFFAVRDDNSIMGYLNSRFFDKTPCFVDVAQQEVNLCEETVTSIQASIVDVKSGTIWSGDSISNRLWKHGKEGSVDMGSLRISQPTSLLYVDENERLYFG